MYYNRARIFGLVASLVVCSFSMSYSYSFTAWTGMIGEKNLSINPFGYVSVSDPVNSSADLVGSYGVTPNVDVVFNLASFGITPSFGYTGSWVMPRYDLWNSNILALQAGYLSTGSFYVAPQYHFFWENNIFAFEFNFWPTFNFSSISNPSISATVVPVYKALPGILALFVETNPTYTIGIPDSFGVAVAPGLCITVPNTSHQICLSAPISGLTTGSISTSVYVWYSVVLSFAPGEK